MEKPNEIDIPAVVVDPYPLTFHFSTHSLRKIFGRKIFEFALPRDSEKPLL